MASPLTLFIAPKTGIKLEIVYHDDSSLSVRNGTQNTTSRSIRSSIDPSDVMKGTSYKLKEMSQFILKDGTDDSDISIGFVSPISNLTLPPVRREKAGIPQDATKSNQILPILISFSKSFKILPKPTKSY
jgi:hypothetical protein